MMICAAFGRRETTKVSSAGPELILCPRSVRARKGNTKVTIYMGQIVSSATWCAKESC